VILRIVKKAAVFLAIASLALAASEAHRYWSIVRSYREAGERAKAGDYRGAFDLYRRISNLNRLSRKVEWAERDALIYEHVYKRRLVDLLDLIYSYSWEGARAIGVRFDRAEDYEYLGYALAALGVRGEAAEMFRKAALLKPESPYASLARDVSSHADGSWYDRLEEVVKNDPNARAVMRDYEFGLFYRRKGMAGEAMERFGRVVDAPDNEFKAEAHYQIGRSYEASGLTDRAIAEYKKALYEAPTHLQGLEGLNRLGLGYDEAIADLSPPHKTRVNLAGVIEVLGYDIAPLDDGRTEIDIYLRCIGAIDKDYRILISGYMKEEPSVGLRRAKWMFVNFGYKLSRPTTLWRLGEVHKDVYIRYMTPGEYRLTFGIWAPAHEEIRLADFETGQHMIGIRPVKLGLPKKVG
jgi:tetratricopeptide (TPR) repeat protein